MAWKWNKDGKIENPAKKDPSPLAWTHTFTLKMIEMEREKIEMESLSPFSCHLPPLSLREVQSATESIS